VNTIMSSTVPTVYDGETAIDTVCITDLSLAGKELSLLPRDIFLFKTLHFLDLSSNCLTHIPVEIQMLPNL